MASSTRSQPAFKHASSKLGKTPSPPAEPGAAGPPGGDPLDPWDVEVVVPPLSRGQTWCWWVPCSALIRVRPCSMWDSLPWPVDLSGRREQLPAQAVTPPLDSDRRFTAVLIFLGFSLLNTRENSQRSLLGAVFLWKFEDKSCCSLFKKQHWVIFHLLLIFFFQH